MPSSVIIEREEVSRLHKLLMEELVNNNVFLAMEQLKLTDSPTELQFNPETESILKICKILRENQKKLICFWKEIMVILKRHPPAENANKFIYGKCCEISGNEILFSKWDPKDMDEGAKKGASFRDDLSIAIDNHDIKFSIKTSKNKSTIILTNKRGDEEHVKRLEGMNLVIYSISELSIYFVPYVFLCDYIKDGPATTKLSSEIFSFMKKNHAEFVVECKNANYQDLFKECKASRIDLIESQMIEIRKERSNFQ